jgi:hypothetical protein
MPQLTVGDFNHDGWIDIFNPGTGSYGGVPTDNFTWLIWNPILKIYENKNLFSLKTFSNFGGNERKSISIDLNKDGYTDVVIFDHGDDNPPNGTSAQLEPIRLVLSDGKGNYDLKDLTNITPTLMYNHSGDIGDLNGDGLPDLVVATGNVLYVSWGIAAYPFFSNKVSYFDCWNKSDNGFGEWFKEAGGGVYNVKIADVDNDGQNDIILGAPENQSTTILNQLGFYITTRVLINQGQGRFNKNGLINLPFYQPGNTTNGSGSFMANDFRCLDLNGDGLNDIIATGSLGYDDWSIVTYTQTSKGVFSKDSTNISYTINTNRHSGNPGSSWKPWLILYDYDGDGQADITYIDPHNYWNSSLKTKSVFLRKGKAFVEGDIFKYDIFLNSIKPK